MKYLKQICVIFLFTFLGEALHWLIPWPVPASIYGMVLLFAALSLKLLPLKAVKETGDFLVSMLPVLFVAPAVGLLDHWERLQGSLIPVLVILVVSTVLVFAIAGWVTQWLVRRKKGEREDD